MVSVEIIKEFNSGNKGFYNIQQEGSLNGTYEELINYTSWILNNNYKNSNKNLLKEVITRFNKDYKLEISKSFLKKLFNPSFRSKKDRINYLLAFNGLRTCPTFRYYNRISLNQNKSNHYAEQLEIIKDKTELLKRQELLNNKFLLLDKEVKRENKKNLLSNCFNFIEEVIDEVRVDKILENYKGFICPDCQNKFWIHKDNKKDYCYTCEQKRLKTAFYRGLTWLKADIIAFIKEHKNSCIAVSNKDLCKEFRKDYKIVELSTTSQTIKKICQEQELKVEIRTDSKKDLIYFNIE